MEKVNLALDKKLNDLEIEHWHALNLSTSSWLLCGASGSGKSVTGMHLLSQIVENTNASITVCDGKHDDYKYLGDVSNARYYGYTDMSEGLNIFFNMFSDRMTGKSEDRSHAIIVLEEWSSILRILEADKENAKIAKRMMSQAFSITSQGRSYNTHALFVSQKPAMDFLSGFRENLTSVIALGRLSPEVAKMCGFTEYEEFSNDESAKASGWFLNDRNRLINIKVPFFSTEEILRFKENIITGVTR